MESKQKATDHPEEIGLDHETEIVIGVVGKDLDHAIVNIGIGRGKGKGKGEYLPARET